MRRQSVVLEAAPNLTNAYASTELTTALQDSLPERMYLENITFHVSSIAGGAATLTFYLASANDLDKKLCEPISLTIGTVNSTAAEGYAIYDFDSFAIFKSSFTDFSEGIYIFAKVDAGTLTASIALGATVR